jgi:hypothetical protein
MIVLYHLLLLTENNGSMKYSKATGLGKSMVVAILVLIGGNTIVIMLSVIKEIKWKLRVRKLGKKRGMILKEQDEALEKSRQYMDINQVVFSTMPDHERVQLQESLDTTIAQKTNQRLK